MVGNWVSIWVCVKIGLKQAHPHGEMVNPLVAAGKLQSPKNGENDLEAHAEENVPVSDLRFCPFCCKMFFLNTHTP